MILIWGFLWIQMVLSAPQTYQTDNVADNLFTNRHSNPDYSAEVDYPNNNQYGDDVGTYLDLYNEPETSKPNRKSYEIHLNAEDKSDETRKPYDDIKDIVDSKYNSQGFNIEPLDKSSKGSNKNYRVVMTQRYKIREPTRYNVSRVIKTTKIHRTRPVVHKVQRTSYYTGFKKPEDGLNGNLGDLPVSAEAESMLGGNVKSSKYYVHNDQSLENAYPENSLNKITFAKELTSQYQPYYKLGFLNQNNGQIITGHNYQELLSNPQYGYSYTHSAQPKQSVIHFIHNSASVPKDGNDYKGYRQFLKTEYRPELLNKFNYGYNMQNLPVPRSYPESVFDYKNLKTTNTNSVERTDEERQVITPENQNIVEVNSTINDYSPEISEFGKRLLQINKFFNDNFQKTGRSKVSEITTQSPIYTIPFTTSGDAQFPSTDLNNINKDDKFESMGSLKTTSAGTEKINNIVSEENDLPKLRENISQNNNPLNKDKNVTVQQFEQNYKFVDQSLEIPENLQQNRFGPISNKTNVDILKQTSNLNENGDEVLSEKTVVNVDENHSDPIPEDVLKNVFFQNVESEESGSNSTEKSQEVYDSEGLGETHLIRSGINITLDDGLNKTRGLGLTFNKNKSGLALENVNENRSGPEEIYDEIGKSQAKPGLGNSFNLESRPGKTSEENGSKPHEMLTVTDEIQVNPVSEKVNESLTNPVQTGLSKLSDEIDRNQTKLSSEAKVDEVNFDLDSLEKVEDIRSGPDQFFTYDYQSTPVIKNALKTSFSPIDVNDNASEKEITEDAKVVPLDMYNLNIQTDLTKNLSNNDSKPDVLTEPYQLQNPDSTINRNDFEASWTLLPIDHMKSIGTIYVNNDEDPDGMRYFPLPEIPQTETEQSEDNLENIKPFPFIDPIYYAGINLDGAENHSTLTPLRAQTNVNVPRQYESVKKNTLNHEPGNDKPNELIKLCKLARTKLNKLRMFVADVYGLNTKTADENHLITIVYILGKLNEARQSEMPVEHVINDFLVNLRRLVVLRKLLCKEFDETHQLTDFNYPYKIDDIAYDPNIEADILSHYNQYSLHPEYKLPYYYDHRADNDFIFKPDNTDKNQIYSTATNYVKHVYRPGTVENVYQNSMKTNDLTNTQTGSHTIQQDYSEKTNQNAYVKKPEYVDHTIYTDKPNYMDNIKQHEYLIKPDTVQRTKQKLYRIPETDYTDFYQRIPDYVENIDNIYTSEPYYDDSTNHKIFSIRPDYEESTSDIYGGNLDFKSNTNVYSSQNDNLQTSNYKNIYKVKPESVGDINKNNYPTVSDVDNTNQNVYPFRTDSIDNTNQNWYKNIPDHVKNVETNMFVNKPHDIDDTNDNKYYPTKPVARDDDSVSSVDVTPLEPGPMGSDEVKIGDSNIPDYADFQNVFKTKPSFENNEFYRDYGSVTATNMDFAPLRPSSIQNTNKNWYTNEPEYETVDTNLFTNKPHYVDDINQNLNKYKPSLQYQIYPVEKLEETETATDIDDVPFRPNLIQHNTNQNRYTNEPDYAETLDIMYANKPVYIDYLNQNLYEIKPGLKSNKVYSNRPVEDEYDLVTETDSNFVPVGLDSIQNTNQNWYNNAPDYQETVDLNLFTTEGDYVDIPIQNSLKSYSSFGNNQYFPIKAVERADDSVIKPVMNVVPNEVHADLELGSPVVQKYPVTAKDVKNSVYEGPTYLTTPPSKMLKGELEMGNVDLPTSEKPNTLFTVTLSPNAKVVNLYDGFKIRDVEDNRYLNGKILPDNLRPVVKKKLFNSKQNPFEGISEEEYKELIEDLKHYDEYDHRLPENHDYLNIFGPNNELPNHNWMTENDPSADWAKMFFDKITHFNVYLNGKKLNFWPGNVTHIDENSNRAHTIRINGYIQKVDLETLVRVAHYQSARGDNELVPTKEISLLLELRDKIDDAIVTNTIWHEVVRLRMIGVSEQKINQFVYMVVTTTLPYLFADFQKCHTELLRHLLYTTKYLELNGK